MYIQSTGKKGLTYFFKVFTVILKLIKDELELDDFVTTKEDLKKKYKSK